MKAFLAGAVIAGIAIATSGNQLLAAATGQPTVVHIKNFKYNPNPLMISAGDSVTFINDDDEAHTVSATDKSFDSEGLDSKGSWKHTFAKAGTYRYFCELHPYMKATIVVGSAKASSTSK